MTKELDLKYPEAMAAAELIKTPDEHTIGANLMAIGIAIGALVKFASSGLNLWKERIEGVVSLGQARLFGGLSLSPALFGVGYILGARVSAWVVFGGILGWAIIIPTIGTVSGWPLHGYYIDDPAGPGLGSGLGGFYQLWFDNTIWVAIGLIFTGGIMTLLTLRTAILKVLGLLRGRTESGKTFPAKDDERDFPLKLIYFSLLTLLMMALFYWMTGNLVIGVIAGMVILMICFFISPISAYLAGLIGSSNNPVSGMTFATIFFLGISFLLVAWVGIISIYIAMTVTIIIASVVCCCAAMAGDSMQALKIGQLLGATPRNLHVTRMVSVLVAAIVIPMVIAILAQAYGIGIADATHATPLIAPQSVITAAFTRSIFTNQLNGPMILLGCALAFVFRGVKISPMAVGIGIFLPMPLTIPLMLGGLASYYTLRSTEKDETQKNSGLPEKELKESIEKAKEKSQNKGVCVSFGLMTGEAIIAVILAILVVF
jgi:putative OPT family oligopeptide transporter